jgi:hypothetical protein
LTAARCNNFEIIILVMLIISTVVVLILLILWAMDIAVRFFRIPPLSSLPVVIALIIAFETVLFNLLSIPRQLHIISVFGGHVLLIVSWLILLYYVKAKPYTSAVKIYQAFRRQIDARLYYLVGPIFLLLLFTALIYPPNTYDSMSYHMARIVHWIQEQSVGYYNTSIDRQNVMGPGAEYLIAIPQLLSKTDYFANLVQFFSLISIVPAIVFFLRCMRVPRNISLWATILTICCPMAILQASSTQNDLVAAAMAYALLISGRKIFLGRWINISVKESFLIGICGAAAYLVKPTALLAVAPFFLFGCFIQLRFFTGTLKNVHKLLTLTGVCFVALTIISGPDIARKLEHKVARPEVYPLLAQWDAARLQNPVAIIAHHMVMPEAMHRAFAFLGYHGFAKPEHVLTIHEDLIGNPVQVLFYIFLSFLSFAFLPFIWKTRRFKTNYFLSMAPLASWVVFGLVVRDQLWISRLQLPLFFLLPFTTAFLPFLSPTNGIVRSAVLRMVQLGAIFSVLYCYLVVTHNPHRPLKLAHFFGYLPNRTAALYNNALSEDRGKHQNLLNLARSQNCKEVGQLLGGNSNEYPLSWRLHQEGRKVHHIPKSQMSDKAKDWPCLFFVDSGNEYRLPGPKEYWHSADGYSYALNSSWIFHNRANKCRTDNSPSVKGEISVTAHNGKITEEGNEIHLEAFNDDPQLLLSNVSCPTNERVVLELCLTSPGATAAQIYYTTKDKPFFNEEQSITNNLHQGRICTYFNIPQVDFLEPLRIDPGNIPGKYRNITITFKSFEH